MFYKIVVKNNWESLSYFSQDGNPLDLDASVGKLVKFKLPDGTIMKQVLHHRINSVSYGDMGHTYQARQDIYYFKINFHGIIFELDIRDVLISSKLRD